MKVGIVGMPNAGKSSLSSALTGVAAEAANYPFTTIEPNIAVVPVADSRLDVVAQSRAMSHDTQDRRRDGTRNRPVRALKSPSCSSTRAPADRPPTGTHGPSPDGLWRGAECVG